MLFPFFLNASSATVSNAIKNKENGTSQIYPVSERDAYKIIHRVLPWKGFFCSKEIKEEHLILTGGNSGLSTTDATFIVVWLDPVNEKNTKITIVTKRKYFVDVVKSLSEGTFYKRFA